MPFNQIKIYPQLLELAHLSERERIVSLRKIFDRDIVENESFIFNKKQIRPTKIDGVLDLDRVFRHLTTEEIEVEENGKRFRKRIYEKDRSERLHWLKIHIDQSIADKVEIFSIKERDQRKRKDILRTYLYNITQKYVVVLEPQRSGKDYYLLTAYYLNKKFGVKMMNKKLKNKLGFLH